jgi:hypothetical protein
MPSALREDPLENLEKPLLFRQYPFQFSAVEPETLTSGALINLDALVAHLD